MHSFSPIDQTRAPFQPNPLNSAGGVDCYYIGPTGQRYRSRLEVCRTLAVSEPQSDPYFGPVPATRGHAYAQARNRLASTFAVTGSVVGGVKVWR